MVGPAFTMNHLLGFLGPPSRNEVCWHQSPHVCEKTVCHFSGFLVLVWSVGHFKLQTEMAKGKKIDMRRKQEEKRDKTANP